MRRREPSVTVSFRLPPDLALDLDRAASAAGTSRGAYSRELVLAALSGDIGDASPVESQDDIKALREALFVVLESLLLNVARASPDDVREHLAALRES